ncbi:MAG TPA: NifB/NifX family molybdenum-iron cluster-binding protein, partial [Nitrospirota bacterium]|nr:NifB/NifX family molybdenum-iron cluster-binding protein [Nitrospirota bacterium]
SPRFDFAPAFGLFEVKEKKVVARRDIFCEGWGDDERISLLHELGVETMICGGLPERLQNILVRSGIQVIPWIAGNADEVLSRFLRGRLEPGTIVCSRKDTVLGKRRGKMQAK